MIPTKFFENWILNNIVTEVASLAIDVRGRASFLADTVEERFTAPTLFCIQ
jgi:hypothetical protein